MSDLSERNPIAVTIGQNIREARKRIGMTQEHLGELTGLHRTEIGVLERGHRVPRADTLFKISVALRLDHPGPLFAGLSYMPPARLKKGTWGAGSGVTSDS